MRILQGLVFVGQLNRLYAGLNFFLLAPGCYGYRRDWQLRPLGHCAGPGSHTSAKERRTKLKIGYPLRRTGHPPSRRFVGLPSASFVGGIKFGAPTGTAVAQAVGKLLLHGHKHVQSEYRSASFG